MSPLWKLVLAISVCIAFKNTVPLDVRAFEDLDEPQMIDEAKCFFDHLPACVRVEFWRDGRKVRVVWRSEFITV